MVDFVLHLRLAWLPWIVKSTAAGRALILSLVSRVENSGQRVGPTMTKFELIGYCWLVILILRALARLLRWLRFLNSMILRLCESN